MEAYSIQFDGKVLERGFWLHVIDVQSGKGRHVYVGRTGDSSSANAGSPFARIGQHLDFRPKAIGNALFRNLRAVGVRPSDCSMRMICVGPLFPEERDFAVHRGVRDKVAALEHGLASAFRDRGFSVLGKHSAKVPPDARMLRSLVDMMIKKLEEAPSRRTSGCS
jgi:hypothetical protein